MGESGAAEPTPVRHYRQMVQSRAGRRSPPMLDYQHLYRPSSLPEVVRLKERIRSNFNNRGNSHSSTSSGLLPTTAISRTLSNTSNQLPQHHHHHRSESQAQQQQQHRREGSLELLRSSSSRKRLVFNSSQKPPQHFHAAASLEDSGAGSDDPDPVSDEILQAVGHNRRRSSGASSTASSAAVVINNRGLYINSLYFTSEQHLPMQPQSQPTQAQTPLQQPQPPQQEEWASEDPPPQSRASSSSQDKLYQRQVQQRQRRDRIHAQVLASSVAIGRGWSSLFQETLNTPSTGLFYIQDHVLELHPRLLRRCADRMRELRAEVESETRDLEGACRIVDTMCQIGEQELVGVQAQLRRVQSLFRTNQKVMARRQLRQQQLAMLTAQGSPILRRKRPGRSHEAAVVPVGGGSGVGGGRSSQR